MRLLTIAVLPALPLFVGCYDASSSPSAVPAAIVGNAGKIESPSGAPNAATDDAQLHFFAWHSAAENPFMTAAERIAHRWLPHMLLHSRSKVPTDAPGQFAFADGSRVRNILEASGWTDIVIEPVDEACRFPASALRQYITQMGPLGRALRLGKRRATPGHASRWRAARVASASSSAQFLCLPRGSPTSPRWPPNP